MNNLTTTTRDARIAALEELIDYCEYNQYSHDGPTRFFEFADFSKGAPEELKAIADNDYALFESKGGDYADKFKKFVNSDEIADLIPELTDDYVEVVNLQDELVSLRGWMGDEEFEDSSRVKELKALALKNPGAEVMATYDEANGYEIYVEEGLFDDGSLSWRVVDVYHLDLSDIEDELSELSSQRENEEIAAL